MVPATTTQPNDLWTADFKGHFRTRDGIYCYPLTIADVGGDWLLDLQMSRAVGSLIEKPQGCTPERSPCGAGSMEIVTSRFLLRDFVEADRVAFLAYHADPRYLAFSGPDEWNPEHARRLFDTFQAWASERPRLNYQLAIVRKQEPHLLVGCCGLREAGCQSGEAELGIELAPDYWGRHTYAVEVGRDLLHFGFGSLGLGAIHGVTVSANARVARLADWFGAETVATRPGAAWMSTRGWTHVEWRITREQWERRTRG